MHFNSEVNQHYFDFECNSTFHLFPLISLLFDLSFLLPLFPFLFLALFVLLFFQLSVLFHVPISFPFLIIKVF
jgi:hypothetical protein